MASYEKRILQTEYSETFDKIRKGMMVEAYSKYGPIQDNYGEYECMDAIGNIENRLKKYLETGNTEYLADIANFAMIEFMYPSICGASYKHTEDPDCELAGISIKEIRTKERGDTIG